MITQTTAFIGMILPLCLQPYRRYALIEIELRTWKNLFRPSGGTTATKYLRIGTISFGTDGMCIHVVMMSRFCIMDGCVHASVLICCMKSIRDSLFRPLRLVS